MSAPELVAAQGLGVRPGPGLWPRVPCCGRPVECRAGLVFHLGEQFEQAGWSSSGSVGGEFNDEVGVEGCADPF
jgi:hypothetical protein